MKNLVSRFVKNESGATAIEYGLIAAGISVAIIAVVQGLGTKLTSTFTSQRPPGASPAVTGSTITTTSPLATKPHAARRSPSTPC